MKLGISKRPTTGHFRHGAARNWAFQTWCGTKLGISETGHFRKSSCDTKLGISETGNYRKLGISDECGHKTGYFRRLWTQNWVFQTAVDTKLGISDGCGHKTGYCSKLGIAANWVFQTSVDTKLGISGNWVLQQTGYFRRLWKTGYFRKTGNFMRRFPVGEQRGHFNRSQISLMWSSPHAVSRRLFRIPVPKYPV